MVDLNTLLGETYGLAGQRTPMATEMPTDQTQVYPLALRQYLHQMVLKYHFC